ncbi:MAG: cytochrome C [candidate division Zixibacteria bacterium]|nr:cytochrome C [candidate division Zixibacteria bacterium]
MYDAGKVIIGIIVFLVIASFPIWYAVAGGKSADIPELEKAAKGDNCVMETEEMRAAHMDLLNDWRKLVVRDGLRYYTAFDGEKVEMSMTKTCLGCHPNKDAFCDRCHNYMAVNPYCWDCHVNPKEFE